ncbi:DsbA family protein [Peptococcaceae bacterium 1198_IL3148]
MGKGIVEQLQREYSLEVKWIGYELHPETPKEGALLKEAFPDLDIDKMMTSLNKAGEPYGVAFKKMEVNSNTRLALEASEFAREYGKFVEFHDAVFKAYFEAGQDIGKLETVLACGQQVGLDVNLLKQALQQKKYAPVIDNNRALGAQHKVAGLPTFIFENGKKIVGAQNYDTFVRAIKESPTIEKFRI